MKITVLRRTEYKGCPLYVLQFATVFQYLFVFKNEIYQYHLFLKPRFAPRILFALGRVSHPYSADEYVEGETLILNAAMTSIDKLTDGKATDRIPE